MPENCSTPTTPSEPDYRFTLANERTFLAWQRTSLGLLAASVAALHFRPVPTRPEFAYGLGALLAVAAITCAAGGLLRWQRNDRAIRSDRPLPTSGLMTALALALTGIGAVTAVAAVVAAS